MASVEPNFFEHLKTTDARHVQIEQHHDRQLICPALGESATRKQVIECFDAVTCADDRIGDFGRFECQEGEIGVVVVVLDQKYDLFGHASSKVKANMAPSPGAPSAQMRPP